MKKTIFLIICGIIFLITLTGCAVKTEGDSLQAFLNRLNSYNSEYNISPNGFIAQKDKSSLTRFFVFGKDEIMLTLVYDNNNAITQLHIVMPLNVQENVYQFACNCIKAFCGESVSNNLIQEIDLKNALKTVKMKTYSTTSEDVTMEIDTHEVGTVLSIYKDK